MNYKHIIGMLFWGDSHTENPNSWIIDFKNKGYTIISVILNASLQTLIQRVQERGHSQKSREEMSQHFEEFNKIRDIFASQAGIREVSIDTEGKNPTKVAEEILNTRFFI